MINCSVPSVDGGIHEIPFALEKYSSNKLKFQISCGFNILDIRKEEVYSESIVIWLFRIDIGNKTFYTKSMSHLKKAFDDTLVELCRAYPLEFVNFDFSHLWSRNYILNTVANEMCNCLEYQYYFGKDGKFQSYELDTMLRIFEDRLLKDLQ